MKRKDIIRLLEEVRAEINSSIVELQNDASADNVQSEDNWRLFREGHPRQNGWYLCTIGTGRYGYVMMLFWRNGKFIDKCREDVFESYKVFNPSGERVRKDWLSDRTGDVVAWIELPEPYVSK